MKIVKKAFRASIPVMMGYIVLGMAFGILLESKGYGVVYSLLMSVFIYAGSMQFVGIDLLVSHASLLTGAMMTLLINARHLVYGISMINKYDVMEYRKPYMIYSLTDETYSLLVGEKTPESEEEKNYLFYVSLFDHCYWVLGSVIGSLIGTLITFNTTGLDFAMTALFIVIVLEQFLTSQKQIYTYIGVIISIICLIVFSANYFIIPSILGIIAGLLLMYKKGGS